MCWIDNGYWTWFVLWSKYMNNKKLSKIFHGGGFSVHKKHNVKNINENLVNGWLTAIIF